MHVLSQRCRDYKDTGNFKFFFMQSICYLWLLTSAESIGVLMHRILLMALDKYISCNIIIMIDIDLLYEIS